MAFKPIKMDNKEFEENKWYQQEMLLMCDCPKCGCEVNREYVENVIDRIIESSIEDKKKYYITQIQLIREHVRQQTGSFKYDDCYNNCIELIRKC